MAKFIARRPLIAWRKSILQEKLDHYKVIQLTCHWHNSIDYAPGTFLGYENLGNKYSYLGFNDKTRSAYICEVCKFVLTEKELRELGIDVLNNERIKQ